MKIDFKITNLKYLKYALFFPVVLTLVACEGRYNPRDQDSVEVTTDSIQRVKISQDNTEMEMHPGAYTYIVDPHDIVVPVVEADSIASTDPEGAEEEKLGPVEIIVSSPRLDLQVNRPPLFGEECLDMEYPVKCSSDKVAAFIRNNLEFPEAAISAGHEGKQLVTIHVTEEGKVNDIQVEPEHNNCESCQTAAYSVVAAMPDDWVPALEDGKSVGTKVTIPIEFKTLD